MYDGYSQGSSTATVWLEAFLYVDSHLSCDVIDDHSIPAYHFACLHFSISYCSFRLSHLLLVNAVNHSRRSDFQWYVSSYELNWNLIDLIILITTHVQLTIQIRVFSFLDGRDGVPDFLHYQGASCLRQCNFLCVLVRPELSELTRDSISLQPRQRSGLAHHQGGLREL